MHVISSETAYTAMSPGSDTWSVITVAAASNHATCIMLQFHAGGSTSACRLLLTLPSSSSVSDIDLFNMLYSHTDSEMSCQLICLSVSRELMGSQKQYDIKISLN